MGFLGLKRTVPLHRRREKLRKHCVELLQRCASNDPLGARVAVKNIDPSYTHEGGARELETMVQNFAETAVGLVFRNKNMAVLRVLCEDCAWKFEVQVGEDTRAFCDRIIDVALLKALSTVNVAGVRLLLSYKTWVPRRHHQFIYVACRCNNVDIVRVLLADERMRGPGNQKQWASAALESARNLRTESLWAMVDANVLRDNGIERGTLLTAACQKGHEALAAKLLSDPRVMVEECGLEALRLAAAKGHVAVMQMLLDDPRISPALNDWVALDCAALGGHAPAVEVLLARVRGDHRAHIVRVRALVGASINPTARGAMESILDEEVDQGHEVHQALKADVMSRICTWDLQHGHAYPKMASRLVRRFAPHAVSACTDDLAVNLVLWAIRAEDVELLRSFLALPLHEADLEEVLMAACVSASPDVFRLVVGCGRVPLNARTAWRAAPRIQHGAIMHFVLRLGGGTAGDIEQRNEALRRACEADNEFAVRSILRDPRVQFRAENPASSLPGVPQQRALRAGGVRLARLDLVVALLRRADVVLSSSTISLVNGRDGDASLQSYVREKQARMREEACACAQQAVSAAQSLPGHPEIAVMITAMAFGDDLVQTGFGSVDVYMRARKALARILVASPC